MKDKNDLYVLYIRFNEEANGTDGETKRMAKFVTLDQAAEIVEHYVELWRLVMESPVENQTKAAIDYYGADIWTEDDILLGYESGTIYARPVFDTERPTMYYKGEDYHTDTVWAPVDWDE